MPRGRHTGGVSLSRRTLSRRQRARAGIRNLLEPEERDGTGWDGAGGDLSTFTRCGLRRLCFPLGKKPDGD